MTCSGGPPGWTSLIQTDAQIIAHLREMLTLSSMAHQSVITERNRYRDALAIVRDDAFTSRGEMRDFATASLKSPEGKKS